METIKTACFGLQGYGNDLVQAVAADQRAQVAAVYTRQTSYPFGYYPCASMESAAQDAGAPIFHVPAQGPWDCEPADLALVSSFHRIFQPEHLDRFRYVINIHAALLPEHRGATPTNWSILQGERITGLTAHLMDTSIDTGGILLQRRILNPGLTDAQLRKALSFVSRSLVRDILSAWPDYAPRPANGSGSYEEPRNEQDALVQLDKLQSIDELVRHIRAFTNYPMPRVEIDGRIFVIDFENPLTTTCVTVAETPFELLGYWQPA